HAPWQPSTTPSPAQHIHQAPHPSQHHKTPRPRHKGGNCLRRVSIMLGIVCIAVIAMLTILLLLFPPLLSPGSTLSAKAEVVSGSSFTVYDNLFIHFWIVTLT